MKVYGSPVKCTTKREFLQDKELAKKELIAQRKKLRLEQVRQKSKQLASQLRQDVQKEKQKQLKRIAETKKKEMDTWRKKQLCEKRDELQNQISQVGGAHRAAENEIKNLNICFPGTSTAGSKEASCKTPNKRKVQPTSYKCFCEKMAKQKKKKKSNGKENLEHDANKNQDTWSLQAPTYQPQDYNVTQSDDSSVCAPKPFTYENQRNTPASENLSPSSDSISCSYPMQKKKKASQLKKTGSVLIEIDQANDCSGVDIDDTFAEPNMKYSRVTSDQICESIKSSPKKRFTKISELLKQQEKAKEQDNDDNDSLIEEICGRPKEDPIDYCKRPKVLNEKSTSIQTLHERCKKTTSGATKSTFNSEGRSNCTRSERASHPPSNRVQFYDYGNKFGKCYNQPNVVRSEERQSDQLNAMQQAEVNLHERNTQQEELTKLSQQCEVRSQRALEKERTRREYEALTAKLDAIAKVKSNIPATTADAYKYSEARLEQGSNNRQKKLNTAVEDVLNRPVLITCEEVDHSAPVVGSDNVKKPSPRDVNLACPQSTTNDFINLNSSDSCTSILLDYVDCQSKLISKDIAACDSREKIQKLHGILDKINELHKKLQAELNKTKTNKESSDMNMEDVTKNITALRRERESVILGEQLHKNLAKREKKLKEKEAILEKKLEEFFKMTKCNPPVENESPAQTEIIGPTGNVITKHPVQIIIQVQDKPRIKTARKAGRNQWIFKNLDKQTKDKECPDNKQVKINEKEVPGSLHEVDSTSSTSYQSVPGNICTPLDKAIEKSRECIGMKKDPCAQETLKKDALSKATTPKTKRDLNPVVGRYIQRLLGMSRTSIDMLGVSSSEIETPSSSIINTTANKSSPDSDECQRIRLERVEKFIADNHSFLSEVENSTDSSLRAIEEIWKRTLKRKENEKTKKTEIPKTLKPILKKDKKKLQKEKDCSAKSKEDINEINLKNKFSELTDTRNQLIERLNQVREEKRRLLEHTNTISSGSGNSTTEYVDFAEKICQKIQQRENILNERQSLGSAEKGRLERNKLTGVSHDSGISMSRPVTSQDCRESPIVPTCDRATEPFEPVLKDIPKPGKCPTQLLPSQPCVPKPIDSSADKQKKTKPPRTIAKYSPDLVEDVLHELSTILEVDSSRLNMLVDKSSHFSDINISDSSQLAYKKFPTFDEIVKNNALEDCDTSTKFEVEKQELLEIPNRITKLLNKLQQHEENFPAIDDYDDQECVEKLVNSLKSLNLSLKKFPTHRENVRRLGEKDLMNTKSIEESECSDDHQSTESESLIDVVQELIRRRILKHSFKTDARKTAADALLSTTKTDISDANYVADVCEQISDPKEKLKNDNQSPAKKGTEDDALSGIATLKSCSSQIDSDDFEKDLNKMGMNWASTMLKKTQQVMDRPSSSTSSGVDSTFRKTITFLEKMAHSQSSSENDASKSQVNSSKGSNQGRALDLREFFTKELEKRTSRSVSSSSNTDGSVTSQFLKALLGVEHTSISGGQTSSEWKSIEIQQKRGIMTSTPVPTRSTSPTQPCSPSRMQKLNFTGSLSTVRYSDSDNRNSADSNQCNDSGNKLQTPSLNLNLNDKRRHSKDRNS